MKAIRGDGTANLAIATYGVLVIVVMSAPLPYGPPSPGVKEPP